MRTNFHQLLGKRDTNDFFKKLDPRIKLTVLLLITAVASLHRESLIGLFIIAAVLAIWSKLIKVFITFFILSIGLWAGFFYILLPMTEESIKEPYWYFESFVLRASIFTFFGVWFALKTNIYDLGCCLEKMRIPSSISLGFIICIRFIPTLLSEFELIKNAMRQRGIYTGYMSILRKPIEMYKLFITPMLIRSLRMADELAVAAEARGIGKLSNRVFYRNLNITNTDIAFALGIIIAVTLNASILPLLRS